MGPGQIVQIVIAIFVILFIAGWEGSQISSTGSFIKDTFNGTPLDQPAAAVEKAGTDLTSSARRSIVVFSGLLILFGAAYLGAKA